MAVLNIPLEKREIFNIILDACHMIKRARNALADIGIFKDINNDTIKWDFQRPIWFTSQQCSAKEYLVLFHY